MIKTVVRDSWFVIRHRIKIPTFMMLAIGILFCGDCWAWPKKEGKVKKPPKFEGKSVVPEGYEVVKTLEQDFEGTGVPQHVLVLQKGPAAESALFVVTWNKRWAVTDQRQRSAHTVHASLEKLGKEQVVFWHTQDTTANKELFQFFKVLDGRLVEIPPEIYSTMGDYQILSEGLFLVAGTAFLPTDPLNLVVAQKYGYDGKRWVKVRHEATKFAPDRWPGIAEAAKRKLVFSGK